jgi:hypothetical protein
MGEHAPANGPSTAPVSTHEKSDVAFRPLAIFLAGLTGTLIAVSLSVAWMFQLLESATSEREAGPATRSASERPGVAAPLLQVSARADTEAMRRREEQWLSEVAWVDEPNKIVRMPIERAMQLTVDRGFPEWPKVDPAPPDSESNATDSAAPASAMAEGAAP